MAEALKILGFPNVHHGLDIDEHDPQWALLSRAADATFPTLPTYTGEPFTRAQWDEIFSGYDAVTDLASFFAPSLLAAYPDARVILVERDIERWALSIRQIFHPASRPWSRRFVKAVEPVVGIVAASTMLKIVTGWTRAERPADIMRNARAAYARHYKEVRAGVPEERLLDFRLGEGWEPLCRFLGREVPDVPFPHLNESAAFQEHTRRSRNKVLKRAASRIFSIPLLSKE